MKVHDVQSALDEILERASANPRGRANADFGLLNDYQLGLGRYTGQSLGNGIATATNCST